MKSHNLKNTARFYNSFFFLYPVINLFLRKNKIILAKEINSYPSGKILEIGIGSGSHIKYYKNHSLIGIDISNKMLKQASKRKSEKVKLIQMNGEELKFSNDEFDYVVISHTITVTSNPEKMISEASRVLKNQGKLFILNHFTPDNLFRYFDVIFNLLSSLLHLRTIFYIDDLKTRNKFTLKKEIKIGMLSYYKLLIFNKI